MIIKVYRDINKKSEERIRTLFMLTKNTPINMFSDKISKVFILRSHAEVLMSPSRTESPALSLKLKDQSCLPQQLVLAVATWNSLSQ